MFCTVSSAEGFCCCINVSFGTTSTTREVFINWFCYTRESVTSPLPITSKYGRHASFKGVEKSLKNYGYIISTLSQQHDLMRSHGQLFCCAPLFDSSTEERTRGGGVQLQLSGSGSPPGLFLLLAAPREGLHPLHLVEESQRPVWEARPSGAAAQRRPGRRLCVCEDMMLPYLLHLK